MQNLYKPNFKYTFQIIEALGDRSPNPKLFNIVFYLKRRTLLKLLHFLLDFEEGSRSL